MQGARRRPYVDMAKEGNAAADRPGRNPEGDGAIRAHLFVGSPRHIGIWLRALLLDLHPASPPSHTRLRMKQVLESWSKRVQRTSETSAVATGLPGGVIRCYRPQEPARDSDRAGLRGGRILWHRPPRSWRF